MRRHLTSPRLLTTSAAALLAAGVVALAQPTAAIAAAGDTTLTKCNKSGPQDRHNRHEAAPIRPFGDLGSPLSMQRKSASGRAKCGHVGENREALRERVLPRLPTSSTKEET